MAYATTNPPRLVTQVMAETNGRVWAYSSADATATVDGSGYITNGGNLGMKVGDLVMVVDTATPAVTMHQVISVSATAPGAVDLSNGTVVGSATNSD